MKPLIKTYLETERLILRPFEITDAAAILALSNDKEVTRYTMDPQTITCEADALHIITDVFHADYKQYGYGRLAVIYKPDQQLIGFCGLKYLPEFDRPDIGYRFLSQYWGIGLATESATAVMQYGREILKLDNIMAMAMPDNRASSRVLEKLGLHHSKDVLEGGQLVQFFE